MGNELYSDTPLQLEITWDKRKWAKALWTSYIYDEDRFMANWKCWLRHSCQFFALFDAMISLRLHSTLSMTFMSLFSSPLSFFSLRTPLKEFFGQMRKKTRSGEEKSSYKKGQRWYILIQSADMRKSQYTHKRTYGWNNKKKVESELNW